jgi:hypothetical protein
MFLRLIVQAETKSIQAGPSGRRLHPTPAKFLASISLDSLFGIEPFQSVALTPWGKKSLSASSAPEKQPEAAVASR